MKKTITVELHGHSLPSSAAAVDALEAYIESLRGYFDAQDGQEEIMSDIEGRIAELLAGKLCAGHEQITEADVEEVASVMGRPSDFERATGAATERTAGTASQPQTDTSSEPAGAHLPQDNLKQAVEPPRRRLWRDKNDRFLGGVCSGVAHYLNVDPSLVRIVFAIVTLGGFGLGFLLYLLLWMLLPAEALGPVSSKRLFRNPDDKILGGVAAGIAAYLGKEPKWVRLAFAAPLLANIALGFIHALSFGHGHVFTFVSSSMAGTFVFTYVVLWALLPEAVSAYDKMNMRGEPIDVNAIKQSVQDGLKTAGERFAVVRSEMSDVAQQWASQAKTFSQNRSEFRRDFHSSTRGARSGLGHAIRVVFQAFFLLIAGTIALSLLCAAFAVLVSGAALWPLSTYLWTSGWQEVLAWGTLVFFLLFPLLAVVTWLIRRVVRARHPSGLLRWVFSLGWGLGWVCAALLFASVAHDVRKFETVVTDVPLDQALTHDALVVAVTEPAVDSGWFGITGWDVTDDALRMSIVDIDVKKSADTNYHAQLEKFSAGTSSDDARLRATNIQYKAAYQDDRLDLGSGFAIVPEQKFRGQSVRVVIFVPADKKLRFDRSVSEKLTIVRAHVHSHFQALGDDNSADDDREEDARHAHHHGFSYAPDIDYTMGQDGVLRRSP